MPEWAQLVTNLGAPLVLLGAVVWWIVLPEIRAGRAREVSLIESLRVANVALATQSERAQANSDERNDELIKVVREQTAANVEVAAALRSLRPAARRSTRDSGAAE